MVPHNREGTFRSAETMKLVGRRLPSGPGPARAGRGGFVV